jgi:hypothetical protein
MPYHAGFFKKLALATIQQSSTSIAVLTPLIDLVGARFTETSSMVSDLEIKE